LRRARGKTYEAGAKLDWHSHPGGQVLLITEGAGYYQETTEARSNAQKAF
jgi:quercetin dioxygenase-like cupin family protein